MPVRSPKTLNLEEQLKKKGIFFIAGADEAGRGPLAGPIVCAMVMFEGKIKIKGLTDSKLLSSKKREVLFSKIINDCLDFAITIVPSEIIDKLNISAATRFGFQQCLNALIKKPELVLVDGIDKQIFDSAYITIVKGDLRVKSISAASILAKVTRDHIMINHYAKIYPKYGFEKHVGYGTRHHRKIISEIGKCDIHRKSFVLKNEKDTDLRKLRG
ncbi:MAG: ribonuclease HII [Candidatus Gracilibacteria bacterium]|jgi:ribonuclease HII|nr:ribonuclease HII [Candidatus Gracilibacteria bacterium]